MSEALEKIFMKHIQENEGIIHKVIMLYADLESDRRDLKQEILFQSWKSYPKFKGEAKFSTWLYRIALNTVLTFKKKAQRKHNFVDKYSVESETNAQGNKEDYEILYTLIKQLNEVDRMIMTLHMEGYKNKEIAEITGINQNNLNVKLHRLKEKIITQFKSLNNG